MKFVIDTNVYLHYNLFMEIDWKKITNSDENILIILPVIIKELDKRKFDSKDSKLAQRAQKIISILDKINEGRISTKKIKVEFSQSINDVDWKKLKLDSSNPDDIIIAETFYLQNEILKDEILLITADLGMKLKAKSLNLECKSPLDEWKREIKDSRDQKIEKLSQSLAKYINAIPEVELLLMNDNKSNKYMKIDLNKLNEEVLTKDIINSRIDQTKQNFENEQSNWILPELFLRIPESEKKRYEKEKKEYIIKYEKYLMELADYQNYFKTIVEIIPILNNYGKKPAENIDIWLHVPSNLKILEKDDLPSKPKKPEAPTPPQPLNLFPDMSPLLGLFSKESLIYPRYEKYIKEPIVEGPLIQKNKNSIQYRLKELKHNLEWPFDPFYLEFSAISDIKSFKIEYTISLGNHPDLFEGYLSVVKEDS